MKKQPAKINYFFKDGYVQLWATIASTFSFLGEDIADAWEFMAEGFLDFWDTFWSGIVSIFSFEFEFDDIWESIVAICKFSFGLGKLLCILVLTTSLCVFFSVVHVIVLLSFMLIVYIIFMLLLLFDTIYRGLKHISSNCSVCQNHFSLPIYVCPKCGAEHTQLRPSKYGIWKRKCNCGQKLPTTFFNGRERLDCRCPTCGSGIKDGGKHVDIPFTVVGGASSGKTCFIHQAITAIGENSQKYGLKFEYSPNGDDDYTDNKESMLRGYLPPKTNDMRLKYYQFYLTPEKKDLKNLISLCDVGGEVYSDSATLGQQIGYKYANAFLLVVDPLSISMFREEVKKKSVEPSKYGYSNQSVDEIVSMLVSTLENMFNIKASKKLDRDIAVVFSKGDIPGLDEKIGESAIAKYMAENPTVTKLAAQNALCESFLKEYDEINFLNAIKAKFKTVQFFCSSSLGHNADGTPFVAQGVEEPVLWLVDRMSTSINLKGKWN